MLQFTLNLRYQDNMVITYLQPGVEYCVTVSVKALFGTNSVPSEPRCAFTSLPPLPASRTLAQPRFSQPELPTGLTGSIGS